MCATTPIWRGMCATSPEYSLSKWGACAKGPEYSLSNWGACATGPVYRNAGNLTSSLCSAFRGSSLVRMIPLLLGASGGGSDGERKEYRVRIPPCQAILSVISNYV